MTTKLFTATYKLLDTIVLLTMILAAPFNISATYMEIGNPVLSTDKAEYAPGETVFINGSGFTPGDYVLSVSGPDGTLDWGSVTANEVGDFAIVSPALTLEGTYELGAIPAGSDTASASISFTVTVPAPPVEEAATEEPTAEPVAEPTQELVSEPTLEPTPEPTVEPTPELIPFIQSDKADYFPGELVTLTGGNWQGDTQVRIFVNDDVGKTWSRDVIVDVAEDGTIIDAFNLPNWFVASYIVSASGQQTGRVVTSSFTDAPGDISKVYQHWSDEPAPGDWNNNILSATKSNYFEGEVIPHVFVYKASNQTPLTNGQSYSFNITYNYYQQNTNAGGFAYITTYNINRLPGPLNATNPYIPPTVDSTFTNGGGTQGIFYTVDANITNVSNVTYLGSGNKDGYVTVTFTYTGTTTTKGIAEVYFGLYIANPGQVPNQGSGTTKGASAWSGGSLQTTVDIGGSGATSIQLSPAAILSGQISGMKFNDLNGNGIKDTGESGLSNWTIILDNDNDPNNGYITTTTTDANGNYLFSVITGTYYVHEVNQTGWLQTAPASGYYGPLTVSSITPQYLNQNFGNMELSTAIDVEKFVWDGAEWQDADSPTGPYLLSNPVQFKFVVTNNSNVTLSSINLTDSDFDLSSCTIPTSLAAGASFTCEITATWTADQHTNTATAVGSYGGTIYNDTDDANYFGAAPAIDIQKTPDTQTVTYNGTANFTIVVSNTGNVPLTNVTVTDPLAPSCEAVVGDLAVGGSTSYTCTLENVTTDFTNVATVNGTYGETTVTDNDDAAVIVDILPDIAVTKTADPVSVPENGGNVEFTFVVTNNSSEPFILDTLTDDKFGDLNGQGTCEVPQTIAAGENYTCAISKFMEGNAGTTHTNIVTASGKDEQGNPDSATDDASVTFTDVLPTVGLVKDVTPSSLPEPGGVFTFTLTIYNTSVEPVTVTTLTDDNPLPAECTNLIGQTIPVDGDISCTYPVTHTKPGTYNNTASVTVTDNDGSTASDTDSESVTVTDVRSYLSVTKSTSTPTLPEPGGTFMYQAIVSNPASNLDPITVSAVSDSYAADISSGCSVTLPVTLNPGDSFTCDFTYVHMGDYPMSWTNTVTATGTDDEGLDATAISNEVTVALTDILPDIAITKDAKPTFVPETGGNVEFTIVVTNNSIEDATIDELTDTDFDLAAHCSDAVGTVLGYQETYTCTFTEWIEGNFSGPAHHNTATVTASDNDNNSDTASDDATVDFTDIAPTIQITKTANPTHVPETGGDVTFTFVVENIGVEDVILSSLTDTVFGNLNGQGDCLTGGLIPVGDTYSCSITQFLASDSLTAHYNVATVVGTDDDGTTATDDDDATVTFDDVAPQIRITKTADPTHVPETGENVTFTFFVENIGVEDVTLTTLDDTKFGDLDGKGTCDVPQTILIGESYTCTYTVFLASDSLTDHYNVVTATAVDDDGTIATDDDDETVTLDDVAPQIRITKSADPTHVPETGGDITFTFFVENIGMEDVTLTTLNDTVFGDLDSKGTCDVPQTILIGGSYTCTYTVFLASDSLTDHYNVVTATAVDDDGTTATDDDDETVTFDDVAPQIRITKSADPTHVPETGDDVTFTFLVENIGVEDVTLTTLDDTKFGDLNGKGTCSVPQSILIGGSYSCEYTVFLASDSLTSHYNVVTATAVDDDGTTATDDDDETVTFDDVAPEIRITKSADPTHVPETGGDVTFTFLVENIGVEDVTLTTLDDTKFGDLNGKGTCSVPQSILISGSYSCEYIVWLEADDLVAHYNVVTATAVDDDGTTATDDDDETVTFDDVAPQIRITKSADPTHVPETGGDVTFTFLVENIGVEDVTLTTLDDTKFGDLDGKGTCDVPQSILIGGSYSCEYTVFLASDSLTDHYNMVTATAVDDDGTTATDDDDETITFDDVAPQIRITKSADPTHVPETGDNVTFTFLVENIGVEDVILSSLTDTIFGNLNGQGDCLTGGLIPVSGTYSCSITQLLASDSLTDHYNVVTATAVDDDGTTATDDDDATVTFDDVAPEIRITKSADPTHVPETGENVTFTFLVENIGVEDVTLTTLDDTKFGDLNGKGTCSVPQSILIGGSYTCTYTVFLASDSLTDHYNVVTATAVDDDGTTATDDDDETVTFDDVAPEIRITKSADPTHVPETGGDITFTFLVENIGMEDVMLTILTDTVFGDLDGKGTCDVPQSILIGGSYSCEYTVFLASDSLTDHYNLVTATAVDDDGTTTTDDDDETVTFDDVAPEIRITKSADPTHVPETGENVTFTFFVENIGVEDVTLTTLDDTKFGDIDGKGTCDVPQSILIGGSYTCTYTVFLASDSLTSHYNVVTATAVDDDGTTATDDDDETVTFDDVAPEIRITKSADPTHVPETGGDVNFTFLVENIGVEDVTLTTLDDTKFGDLNGKGTCSVPQSILIGGSYSCEYIVWLEADDLVSHYNVVTATAVDDDGTTDTDDDDATVTFDDVAPEIRITKTADPIHVPETGDNATFTFFVENIGVEDITLTSLTDTIFGDLNNKGTCSVPQSILIGGSYSCEYTVFLASDSLTDHYNVVTATAVDDDGTTATDDDDETVTFDDVMPDITIAKSANPTSVPETGGNVTFTIVVTNYNSETVTLDTLTDSDFGDLNGQGTCITGGTIVGNGGTYTCTITKLIAGDYESGIPHENTVTATASDNDGNSDTASDDATVTFTDIYAGIDVEKLVSVDSGTTWHDADSATGPYAAFGQDVQFKFVVTNTGNTTLKVTLSDSDFDLSACTIPTSLAAGGSFECTITVTAQAAQHHNTATANGSFVDGAGNAESASDTDDAHYYGMQNLTVTKTASGTFDREYLWSIDKQVDNKYKTTIDQPVEFNYDVIVSQTGVKDSNWKASGQITITNPNEVMDITASITDVLPGATCVVKQGTTTITSVIVPKATSEGAGSVTLSYACTFATQPANYTLTNTATVTWDKTAASTPDGTASGTKEFTLTKDKTKNQTVSVTDTYVGDLGTVTATDTTPYTTYTFEYARSINPPSNKICETYDNTAIIVETGQSDSEKVQVCLPSLVTSSSLCTFDYDSSMPGNQFRLIFTPAVGSPSYKLNASNPGQFYYNIFYSNDTDQPVTPTVTITLPYPFVTQGAVPIHAYSGVTVTQASGQYCLTPGKEIFNTKQFNVTLGSYATQTMGATTTLNVTLPEIPAGGFVYTNIHLDYGLKDSVGYGKDGSNNATIYGTSTIRIPDKQWYGFADNLGLSHSVQSLNIFKKNPGVGGKGYKTVTTDPLPNSQVLIYNSSKKLVATLYTDMDGWYMWSYKYTGKPTTFYITMPAYGITKTITLKSNGYVEVNFNVP